jgi:hypothetical protein
LKKKKGNGPDQPVVVQCQRWPLLNGLVALNICQPLEVSQYALVLRVQIYGLMRAFPACY